MWLEYLRLSLSVLRGHKFRTFLTVGSITIGAFSIVLMTSLANGGLATLTLGMEEIGGARLLAVWSRSPSEMEERKTSYSSGITRHDVAALRQIPHVADQCLLSDIGKREVTTETGKRIHSDVVGSDARFVDFFAYRIEKGRPLDENDRRSHSRVCIVGAITAEQLGDGNEIVGRNLTLAGTRCQVVGRLARIDRFGMRFGWDWDEVVVMPFESLADAAPRETISAMWLINKTDDTVNNEIVKRVINTTVFERHHGVNDFQILDFHKGFIESFLQVFRIMTLIVGMLSGIALLVGGVGIMNIMLVSVSERVREIGIRKALGASARDIGWQFLTEAMVLSGAGGLVGAGLGAGGAVLGAAIIRNFKPRWVTAVSEPAVLIALVVSVFIGVVFGFFPARRASRLDPVQAIRTGV